MALSACSAQYLGMLPIWFLNLLSVVILPSYLLSCSVNIMLDYRLSSLNTAIQNLGIDMLSTNLRLTSWLPSLYPSDHRHIQFSNYALFKLSLMVDISGILIGPRKVVVSIHLTKIMTNRCFSCIREDHTAYRITLGHMCIYKFAVDP